MPSCVSYDPTFAYELAVVIQDGLRRMFAEGEDLSERISRGPIPIDEAIRLIHAAGGCTVLAHPPFIGVDDETLVELLHRFIAMGLDGLEAYNSGTGNDDIDRYISLARRKGLIVTGGSDFHQPLTGGIVIGAGRGNLKIPYRCVEEIRNAIAARSRPAR